VLEYYSGILILTTNRVGEFDEAITSRVHCALYYPPFNKSRALEVWRKNIQNLQRQNEGSDAPVEHNESEIMKFARCHWKAGHRWNGRQIKNAFQTAVALSDWDNIRDTPNLQVSPRLKVDHFDTVAAASAHFDHYLTKVRNPDRLRASVAFLRRDDVTDEIADFSTRRQSSKVQKVSARPPWPSFSSLKSGSDSSDHSGSSDSDSNSEGDGESDRDNDSESDSESEPVKKKKTKKSKSGKKRTGGDRLSSSEKTHKKTKEKEKRKLKAESKMKTKRSPSKKPKQVSSSSSPSETESKSH